MLAQSMLNAAAALLFAYIIYVCFNRDGTELPGRMKAYYYVTNETQKLLDESQKEAARVVAAQVVGDATADVLMRYGVALRDGDEGLAATIKYVHQYGQLATASQHQRDGRAGPEPSAASDHPPVRVHIFLAADNGTYSGMHELFYIAAAMRYSTRLHVEGCRSALFGFLEKPARDSAAQRSAAHEVLKVPVLAVTTGIYVTSAAACTAAVMELPMFDVQSVTLIGTAGVSPVVGGGGWSPRVPPASPAGEFLEASEAAANPACQQYWAPESEKVALGSVCVTYASLTQECGLCVEDNDLSSLCSRPRCRLQNAAALFGPCAFRHPMSSFAEQMKRAMAGKPFPSPSATVREAVKVFWGANEATIDYVAATEGTQTRLSKRMRASRGPSANASAVILSYDRLPPTTPILLNCAEVSTSQILAGPRSDVLCRQYTEEVFEGRYVARDLTCVQAMEGVGVLHVLTREYPTLPVAIVRGASNYDMFPLSRHVYRLRNTAIRGRRADNEWYVAWDQKEHYISDDEFHRYTKASYQYSIETASAVVLNYFLSAETVLPGM
ncbi:hypothetical protein LSCM1_02096 [Leishmania martiniquensis]|uniref:Uncharacterized protein n=1 Tax=Leishmania martiniquensis TaxID=1580590 RepID=A0A836K9D1_9TRYP|nr:hypothetical protein LSCM1_02096 [Leishmania martiniquensis]